MIQATRTITQIAQKTEDKAMHDAREKAIRDYRSAINSARREGQQEGKQEGQQIGEQRGDLMGTIRALQEVLLVAQTEKETLRAMSMALVMAVIDKRLSELTADDRRDFREVFPCAFSEDPEERESAIRTLNDILSQPSGSVSVARTEHIVK